MSYVVCALGWDLQTSIGYLPVSPRSIVGHLQAVTHYATDLEFDYERMENLGDAFLKLAVVLHV